MDVNHFIIAKTFEKKVNFALRVGVVETKPTKIKSNVFGSLISNSLVAKRCFVEDFGLLIVKNCLPMRSVENVCLKQLIMHLCPSDVFPFIK